jgi:glycosyltransferase involved in cell wall biosynthesis
VKIALVVPGGVDRSGEYRVVPALVALIARLSALHEVCVFALHQEPDPASWNLAGARIHNIGNGSTRLRAIGAIRAEHRDSPFQLVHSIWAGASGLVGVVAARLLGVPSVVHAAGGEFVRLPEIGYGGLRTWRGRLQEGVVLRGATALTAPSVPMIELLARLGFAARRVPLGADLTVWSPRAPREYSGDTPARLVHAASLNRVKDQPTLLRALAALARSGLGFQMDIVGEDTLGGEMQAMARDLGIAEQLRFHGFLPQRELYSIVARAHLMVMSSLHEAGPLATLEAAVLGVPTVGTAVGHIAEWAPRAAIAVPTGDAAALAEAVKRVLTDEALRLALAREAAALAMREDADYTARCFGELYVELVAAGRRYAQA